ncbi:MAG: hypothetical protein WA116_08965 [Anaerolineaceae bacterium]
MKRKAVYRAELNGPSSNGVAQGKMQTISTPDGREKVVGTTER